MSDEELESEKPIAEDLIDGARRIADDADRWFVSLARGIGRTARWTKDEATLVADAAVAAGRTTGKVTKEMLSRLRIEPTDEAEQPHLDAALRRLGALVTDCPDQDYAALRTKREFWRLLSQIQELRTEVVATAPVEVAAAQASEEADTPVPSNVVEMRPAKASSSDEASDDEAETASDDEAETASDDEAETASDDEAETASSDEAQSEGGGSADDDAPADQPDDPQPSDGDASEGETQDGEPDKP